ncbi:hypothetical protein [Ammoniphilus sp. 3BR4]|uniref:hypothetical protein n=1 Tax=Ammoniphilus sp. 3BR4 TaxID=3158265 RepID=UPI003467C9AD
MGVKFFDNYKQFVTIPPEKKPEDELKFHPEDYDKYFIITVSLYNPLVSCWREANKYHIEIETSLNRVGEEFNKRHWGSDYLQVLELEEDKLYFVWALSCKSKKESKENLQDRVSYFLEKLSNSLYVGESWYQLIGDKGRINRQLFSYTWKEYIM